MLIKQSTKHMSYENKKVKRFPVIVRSNKSRNVGFGLFLVIFTHLGPLKGVNMSSKGPGDK